MTKDQLEAVVDALAEVVDSWNEAAEDDDRGPANDALCLTLWDDGSGSLGRRSRGVPDGVEDWHDFPDPAGLAEILADYGVEFDDLSSAAPDKRPLDGLFRDRPETPEGKYLVKRRDGTVPEWPSFVLGGADPHAAHALRAYADSCAGDPAIHPGFVAALRRWADTYDRWRAEHGSGDPGMGPHRKDDPATVAEMRKGFSA